MENNKYDSEEKVMRAVATQLLVEVDKYMNNKIKLEDLVNNYSSVIETFKDNSYYNSIKRVFNEVSTYIGVQSGEICIDKRSTNVMNSMYKRINKLKEIQQQLGISSFDELSEITTQIIERNSKVTEKSSKAEFLKVFSETERQLSIEYLNPEKPLFEIEDLDK